MSSIDDTRNCLLYQPLDLNNWALEDFDKKDKCDIIKDPSTIKDPVVENIYRLDNPVVFTRLNEDNYGNTYENEYATNYEPIYESFNNIEKRLTLMKIIWFMILIVFIYLVWKNLIK